MSKPNQMYIAILAVSMVLILAYMYMCRCYQDQPLAAKDSISIWGKMGKIIGVQSEQTDEDCESDNFLDMEGYLESRRKCLLKHCGDVCTTTKSDAGKIMILQVENRQSIDYNLKGLIYILINLFTILFTEDHLSGDIDNKIDSEVGRLKSGNYANLVPKQKHFECNVLFESKVHDLPAPTFMTKPFKDIPERLRLDYTYDGRIKINSYYIDYNFPTNRIDSK